MRAKRCMAGVLLFALALFLCACSQQVEGMRGGYYRAEAASFDAQGWKEYITIYVSDGKILTVEYDAYNASGFVRSWDIRSMREIKKETGSYPSEITRAYAVALVNWQNTEDMENVSGSADYYMSFQMLAEAAIAQAKTGNRHVALVELTGAAARTEG